MATITYDPSFNLQKVKEYPQHRVLFEEIESLIKVYRDGHVERPQIVPNVTSKLPLELGVISSDVVIDRFTNVWARLYVPKTLCDQGNKLPLLIYFHGGGFCVGSASWICYHEFLAKLASIANCVIMSVNYRLAPENRLPAAYDDGVKTIAWIRRKVLMSANEDYWWLNKVDFSSIYLAGDSAGGNIAHNVAIRLHSRITDLKPIYLKGVGHAFQVLNKSQVAQARTADLIAHIKTFISR
ncbi:unnamed protein product [Withania somnifera]